MLEMKFNLLTEPLIGVRLTSGERRHATLPDVFALLEADSIEAFTALQPHQKHAWHAFLVQLAAIALHRAGKTLPVGDSAVWTSLLLALTEMRHEPWCLIVEDLARPAFLQPPVPEGNLREFKTTVECSDELDILNTAKNHDVKGTRCRNATAEHWVFALVNLQTMQGFLGAGNYGIARMNGGFSNRPCVAFAPDHHLGPRFRRDTDLLLAHRAEIAADRFRESGGHALIWLVPWDGTISLAVNDCDPFFIEVCRRVRFVLNEQRISAVVRSTKTSRIEAKDLVGNTGDPWTPIDQDGKALTVPGSGFTYRRVQDLMFRSDFVPAITQRISPKDPSEMLFLTWALVRGKGITEGLHQRVFRLPGHIRRTLSASEGKARLGGLAKRRVECVGEIQNRVLKPALCALLQGGKEKLNFKDDRPQRWITAHETGIDSVFFEHLWEDITLDPGEADRKWQRFVLERAREQLNSAMESCPLSSARQYRAFSAAERIFAGSARKLYPEIHVSQEKSHE